MFSSDGSLAYKWIYQYLVHDLLDLVTHLFLSDPEAPVNNFQ